MNMNQKTEIVLDEVNLYDYWKIIVKRKKIFLAISIVPLVIVTIVSLILPSNYRSEGEITNLVIPAPILISHIGNIDDTKKVKIFANSSGAIKSVGIVNPQQAADKIGVIIDAKTADILPQAFKNIFDYISNLPEIQKEIASIKEENDFKLNKLVEAKETNLLFLNYITDLMKKRRAALININPADLIKKDADLALEIMKLQRVKVNAGILGTATIIKQPTNAKLMQIIIFPSLISLFMSLVIVFFLEYLEKMKARDHKL